ncbi:MAG TPA: cytochrome b/b6 domain-containing protein [Herminiimonas sp.]|jgi:cytochrome b|nr:cytochrome b/b6 domain-containing protein [Herminiimonas sp.]
MQPEAFIDCATIERTESTVAHTALTRIHVWDLPIRIFHWALVAAVTTAIITGELGGTWMPIHEKAGLTIIGLVVFRLVWGFVGSTHARFLNFVPSPKKINAYVKGKWQGVGHNPLGALSVFALLGLLALQAGTGLFSNDDITFSGPLSSFVDEVLSHRLTAFHQLLSYLLLGLTALHVLVIGFYVWYKKHNLIKPMVTGWTEAEVDKPAEKGKLPALILALLFAFVAVYFASGAFKHAAPLVKASTTVGTPAW